MKATVKVSITVTADDGAIQAREYTGELQPKTLLDVQVFCGMVQGAIAEAMERGWPMDHPQIVAAIASGKQQCEAGFKFAAPPAQG